MADGVRAAFPPGGREQLPLLVGKKAERPFRQVFGVNSIANDTLAKAKDAGGAVSPEVFALFATDEEIAKHEADLRAQHIDRRIQLFFMQLITVYRTPYHFEWVGANDQFGKGRHYTLKSGGQTKKVVTQGAHSSTLPTLTACDRAAFERGDDPEKFVWSKYGHPYLQHNATMELHVLVNNMDTKIDGTHGNPWLRESAIQIVNEVAKGSYGPREGVKRFVRKLEYFIRKAMKDTSLSRGKRRVLEQYLARVEEVKRPLQSNPGYFDTLLGLNVQHEKEDVLRDVVYGKRFRLIQKCEAIESGMARAILDAQNTMLKKNRQTLKSIDARLRYVLLDESSPLLRMQLEKLFCTSLSQLQLDMQKMQQSLRTFERKRGIGVASFRVKHKVEIQKLRRALRSLFYEMTSLELDYRADLMRGLRKDFCNWTGQKFSDEFEKLHPGVPMYPCKVSRLEQRARPDTGRVYVTPVAQRRKDLEIALAKKVARTFEIDPGLFLPAIVGSAY